MKTTPMPAGYMAQVSQTIKIIGHPQRLRILEYIDLNGESTVGTIVAGIGGQQAAVSQHLNKMRLADIIRSRRDGRQVYYHSPAENAVTILTCIRRKFEEMSKRH
ncbi:MAG: helix-turn-helix transcriptional regulator [Lentisphaerae bacterium]|nr:helix-turn-helix transcriptional regulator [Lentisphaerota bacterium]